MKEELKEFILINAFDGWKDTTDDNVLRAIDMFFDQYQPERLSEKTLKSDAIVCTRDIYKTREEDSK